MSEHSFGGFLGVSRHSRYPRWNQRVAGVLLAAAAVTQVNAIQEGQNSAAKAEQGVAQLRAQNLKLQQELAAKEQLLQRMLPGVSRLADISPEVLSGEKLAEPEQLTAYGTAVVGTSESDLMQGSTVKIFRRSKYDRTGQWAPDCTGTLVSDATTSYILSAKHCFNAPFSPNKGGPGETSVVPNGPAANVSDYDPNMYTVVAGGQTPDTAPSAPVSAISVSVIGDWALLKVDNGDSQLPYRQSVPFENHQSIEPVRGEAVESFSMPGSANGSMVNGQGIYLGRMVDPDNSSILMDVVGLTNADRPSDDACDYGASGSSAVMAGGYVTGPLSYRDNVSYAPNVPPEPGDSTSYENQLRDRLLIETILCTDMSQFNTLCGYTVVTDPPVIPQLVQGFNELIPAVAYYGGK